MALTLAQKDALTTNDDFLARVRQAIRERAKYRLDGGGDPTAEQTSWANLMIGPNNKAAQAAADMAGHLVCDAVFAQASNADASDVSDSALKAAVELICEGYQ